jgi:hypothetical protein
VDWYWQRIVKYEKYCQGSTTTFLDLKRFSREHFLLEYFAIIVFGERLLNIFTVYINLGVGAVG